MSKLTKFEALQLSATLLSGRLESEDCKETAKILFNMAESILSEDSNRKTNSRSWWVKPDSHDQANG